MTLKQAAAIVQDEYDAECAAWNPAQALAAGQITKAEMDDLTDSVMTILASFFHQATVINGAELAVVSMRFGMRVQRKLDNPGEPTTVYCGASTESDARKN